MSSSQPNTLNPTELAVLKVLWVRGRRSAREVHDELGVGLGWAPSTTRTTLDRMARKGLLYKQAFHGVQLYAPAVSRAAGLVGLIREFADKVLDGPVAPVLSLVEEAGDLTADEIAELRAMVDEHDGGVR
jgi:predicted transcriptional regulator